MNTAALKSFAPAVRRQLIEAVTRKLDFVLSAQTPDYVTTFAPQVAALRRLAHEDRPGLVERVAYTWFNRLTALRYLDARGWHPFRARVLTPTSTQETQPELLKLTRAGTLPKELRQHTDPARLDDLLDGHLPSSDPQGEVYRHLVLAACRFYHALLPNLFERVDDETELLLPDDLLTEHSITHGFRVAITDDDCAKVELLGWLYQFYISEKKDAVMARTTAVPIEDIPAVTQLFTPDWIVRYLVENSLGRLWLLNRPTSRLREHMPYYIQGDAESDFLRVKTPEEIRLLDPAVGSGHMLTYAFDLLCAIYEEEGYALSEIPRLILTYNLHGLDICSRATQLAAMALVFKAREKSVRFLQPSIFVQPRILALHDVCFTETELNEYVAALRLGDLFNEGMLRLLRQFEAATNLGSLIQPCLDEQQLALALGSIQLQDLGGHLFLNETHQKVLSVLQLAMMLTRRYHVTVANPPYMGSGGMNRQLREFARDHYPTSKLDLCAMFMERAALFTTNSGYFAMVTMQAWMFLSSYEPLRVALLTHHSIIALIQIGYNSFPEMNSKIAQACAFVFIKTVQARAGLYLNLNDAPQAADKEAVFLAKRARGEVFLAMCHTFVDMPCSPIAYWLSPGAIRLFRRENALGRVFSAKSGVMTGDDEVFLRHWYEVSCSRIGFGYEREADIRAEHAFFPMNKEDGYRKWSGRFMTVFRYVDHGREFAERTDLNYRLRDKALYFRAGISWGDVTSGPLSFRYQPNGLIFAARAPTVFADDRLLLAFLNSKLTVFYGAAINPTLSFNLADLYNLPYLIDRVEGVRRSIEGTVESLIELSSDNWKHFESSWDFSELPFLQASESTGGIGEATRPWKGQTLFASWMNWKSYCDDAIRLAQELEVENNRLWIDSYDLAGELTPEVPEDQITLPSADARRDMAAFLSYAIGCMMGRYSLDKAGLVLADASDTLERYFAIVGKPPDQLRFIPNADGIIPVLDGEWFDDDVVASTRGFLRATFGEATLRENVRFLEEALGRDLRKYFLADFYRDHLQTYKKRPIYWLVQSPRKGFSVLIYLHRYTRDTMNVVLNRYLREYQVKLRSRLSHLAGVQVSDSISARDKTTARKEADKLTKTLHECEEWERETVLPLAQARIELNLDDGVKANYLKLGDALAPIPGFAAEDE
jgi:hypothetical protein